MSSPFARLPDAPGVNLWAMLEATAADGKGVALTAAQVMSLLADNARLVEKANEVVRAVGALVAENARIVAEVARLQAAIRRHRDYRGDDRCWLDDEELYRALPEGFVPPARDSAVELDRCRRYIACRHNPATEYVSPEREVVRLRAEADTQRRYAEERREALEAYQDASGVVGRIGYVDSLDRSLRETAGREVAARAECDRLRAEMEKQAAAAGLLADALRHPGGVVADGDTTYTPARFAELMAGRAAPAPVQRRHDAAR